MHSGGNERSIVRFSRCGNFGSDGPEDFYVFTEEVPAKRGVYVLDKVFIRPVKVEVRGSFVVSRRQNPYLEKGFDSSVRKKGQGIRRRRQSVSCERSRLCGMVITGR